MLGVSAQSNQSVSISVWFNVLARLIIRRAASQQRESYIRDVLTDQHQYICRRLNINISNKKICWYWVKLWYLCYFIKELQKSLSIQHETRARRWKSESFGALHWWNHWNDAKCWWRLVFMPIYMIKYNWLPIYITIEINLELNSFFVEFFTC